MELDLGWSWTRDMVSSFLKTERFGWEKKTDRFGWEKKTKRQAFFLSLQ